MATPIQFHIIPDCGLKIEINASKFHGLDNTNSKRPWKYKVTNYDQICPNIRTTAFHQEDFCEGWLSPAARLTLPPGIKEKAGIPKNATSFSFLYPPEGLAEILSQRKAQDVNDSFHTNLEFTEDEVRMEGIKSVAILGGFAYFDKHCNCIAINALSMQRTKGGLRFSGPFEVNQSVCDTLYRLRRPHPLQLDILHEVGFVSYAWVRPKEMFSRSVFAIEGPENRNGTMIFFRENGSGVAYSVDNSDYVDLTGYVGILSEALGKIGEAKFAESVMQPLNKVHNWWNQVEHCTKQMVLGKRTLKDKRTLIHMACHADLGHKFISDVVSSCGEINNLLYQDSFGWNPLHYACCISPSDCTLIKLLVTKCPEAVVQFDYYGRSPLHIACNSNTSKEVITVLLEADTFIPKITVNKKTLKCGLLPLHFACFNGAHDGIINALLDADCGNKTAVQKSSGGYLPLHLAILKKLPASMVKTFLDVDSKLNSGIRNIDRRDIYQRFDGKLPLHLACYNNSASEIIELLLEKDRLNTTLNKPVSLGGNLEQCNHSLSLGILSRTGAIKGTLQGKRSKIWRSVGNLRRSVNRTDLSPYPQDTRGIDGVLALHLAMKHGSTDVISLLLQKEIELEDAELQDVMVYMRDRNGRTPLHIACHYNVNFKIIQDLLDLDLSKETTRMIDSHGYMPIHYACENKDTVAQTINILLDAEEQYIEENSKQGYIKRRSTHIGDSERHRIPLYFAVKSNVEVECFERLLQPENFLLRGFNDTAMADLAKVVQKSKAVQVKVVARLAKRIYFGALLLELYACIGALVFFYLASVQYVALGSNDVAIRNHDRAYPYLLLVCTLVFILREALQILSVGVDYISDIWSWFEVVNIALLLRAYRVFHERIINCSENNGINFSEESEDVPRRVFVATGFFITLQCIFYLRNTFLPFARFVGGLANILRLIIPFLVISFLLFWSFVYASWISNTSNDPNCLSTPSISSIGNCLGARFQAIFNFSAPQIGPIEILFAIIIIIVLLNIVIAIVGEAWTSTAQKSNVLFWKYRLQKIFELRYALKMQKYLATYFTKFAILPRYWIGVLEKIDEVRNISFRSGVSWARAPYHVLTEKDHYDNPHRYFGPDLVKNICDAHSLQGDMYWANIDGDFDLRPHEQFIIVFKWLSFLVFYCVLIVLGFPLLGILWPKKFRAGILTLGVHIDCDNIHGDKRDHKHE